MTFFFAGGGSAGHINPALAMADMLRRAYPGAKIAFIGKRDGMEYRLVKEVGYPFYPVKIEGLHRSLSPANIRAAFLALTATSEVEKMLLAAGADLVIGTGGYVTYPLAHAAHRLKIPVLLHESNATAGLAVRLCEKVADKVLLQFSDCKNTLRHPEKAVTIGAPLREGFSRTDRKSARRRLGLSESNFLLLSFGGSLGAEKINRACLAMMKTFSQSEPGMRHIHGCGEKYYASLNEEDRIRSPQTLLLPYINDMPGCMRAADLVICRAGAMTLSELAATGTPAILIPSPNVTGNHQYKNAKAFEKSGGAYVLCEEELSAERLWKEIKALKDAPLLLKKMSECAKKNAAEDTEALFLAEVRHLLSPSR